MYCEFLHSCLTQCCSCLLIIVDKAQSVDDIVEVHYQLIELSSAYKKEYLYKIDMIDSIVSILWRY